MSLHRKLTEAGYAFTGQYSRDREQAKAAAAEWRKQGFYATVVMQYSKGRAGRGATGYSVYKKPKPTSTSKGTA